MKSEERITPEKLARRLRNRIIETLELTSSFEVQLEYRINAPIANVPAEVICQWEDWVPEINDLDSWAIEPIFNEAERNSIREYNSEWNLISDILPKTLGPLQTLLKKPEWNRLKDSAQKSLAVFQIRGKNDEN